MNKKVLNMMLLILLSVGQLLAQKNIGYEFDTITWDVSGKGFSFVEYNGEKSLLLNNGIALLANSQFKNGIIDFDVSFSNTRKFVSIYFRSQDSLIYERFYIRPHQSGNPDATQYTPVINGLSAWQLYYGEGYSMPADFNFDAWNHVRLVIRDKKMDVFINDMSLPILHVFDLKLLTRYGGVGVGVSRGEAYFSNFTLNEVEHPDIIGSIKSPKSNEYIITKWTVSSAFSESRINEMINNKKEQQTLEWKELTSEKTGVVNLAQISSVTAETNTVLVKKVIYSDFSQTKKLDFGYSDEVSVYINDEIQYSGQRKFRSQDYRFLGTMGYFDSVYLKLKKGKNEIVFAVSEGFGGWGLQAKLEDYIGIMVP